MLWLSARLLKNSQSLMRSVMLSHDLKLAWKREVSSLGTMVAGAVTVESGAVTTTVARIGISAKAIVAHNTGDQEVGSR
ncbi:uncharacterized protein MYCGRDRAFT_104632 [Zymoseptoria tritici IPO323]|uniref:Uncharacterized protein n=1 Tax=Zymoseptoria tritici (strain CBS 115943 / IPO323) TaxID=336722 RepID=F9XC23_ZYMTI|nr:uncharacterized protein MYCGRDRAFT_104632 [Zymoseptoria tritici IPO323]EGP87297.1 hypothetical protein MYCGRDRAFT_104632 [Zymoseptoria tritici IPO323]